MFEGPVDLDNVKRTMDEAYPELRTQKMLVVGNEIHFVQAPLEDSGRVEEMGIFKNEKNRLRYLYFVRHGSFGTDPQRLSEILAILGQDDWNEQIVPYVLDRNHKKLKDTVFFSPGTQEMKEEAARYLQARGTIGQKFLADNKLPVFAQIKGALSEKGGYDVIVGKQVLLVERFAELACAIVEHEEKKYVVREQDLYLAGMTQSSYEQNYDKRWEEDHEYF